MAKSKADDAEEVPSDVDSMKQRGNMLYRDLKFAAAAEVYSQALELAPCNAVLLSNKSACFFEMGQYETCITFALKALKVDADSDVGIQAALKTKLQVRLTKSYFYLQGPSADCRKWLHSAVSSGSTDPTLLQIRDHTERQQTWDSKPQHSAADCEARLWRCRPMCFSFPLEYCALGHDSCPVTMPGMMSEGRRKVFLGGCGDGRFLLNSLTEGLLDEAFEAKEQATKEEEAGDDGLDITCNDVKVAALARICIVVSLLKDLGTKDAAVKDGRPLSEDNHACALIFLILHLQTSPFLMPSGNIILMETLQQLSSAEKPPEPVLCNAKDWAAIREVLRSWAALRVSSEQMFDMYEPRTYGCSTVGNSEYEGEKKLFAKTKVPPLPSWVPGAELLGKETGGVHLHWKPNVTLVDPDEWNLELPFDYRWRGYLKASYFTLLEQVFGVVVVQDGPEADSVQEPCVQVLNNIFCCAQSLCDARTKIRAAVCDVHEAVERAVDEGRNFDLILLSNVPDYTGMLNTFASCIPALSSHPGAGIGHNILLSPIAFRDLGHYVHASSCIPSLVNVQEMLGLRVTQGGLREPEYVLWMRRSGESADSCVSREMVEAWLLRVFFYICLPCRRKCGITDYSKEFCPLTLNTFFATIGELIRQGYPIHWMSDVLSMLLSNSLVTNQSPPQTSPNPCSAAVTRFSARKVDISPFVTELKVLAGLWKQRLAIPVACEFYNSSQTSLYSLSATVHTSVLNSCYALNSPCLGLAFVDCVNAAMMQKLTSAAAAEKPGAMKSLLESPSPAVHAFSAFHWEYERVFSWEHSHMGARGMGKRGAEGGKGTITVCLPRHLAESWCEQSVYFVLFRTDSWSCIMKPQRLRQVDMRQLP